MYSLVNIATVVRDIARHPRADEVALELLRAFALDADALAELDAAPYDEVAAAIVRAEVVAADRSRPRALTVLASVRSAAADTGIDAYAAGLTALAAAPLGDLDDLLAFVRRELVADGWTGDSGLAVARYPRALAVVSDGVAAAYTGDRRLGRPWRAWVARRDRQPPASPWSDVVTAVRSVPAAASWPHPSAAWAQHMHDACWAVNLTGRGRDAAVTQLLALRELLAVHAPAAAPLRAVATTVAAVHAHVVSDILDGDTHAAMTQPLFRLLP